ncbi:MAG: hypothetical protein HXK20_04425 [Alloprevotella tannerae]|uniref:Uncharacterized protein n=1 Tax=Alloprevotella tannerae TaxID=76122 RepID=A0A929WX62_9BACT|nr:hypothetical protein [Alloprevotella tannerae]MBF0961320.1 hypothetical protein [Alloprevotella tannerae]MBF0969790.1 hypothetical protein [Alloprevotella tannerae]
MAKDRETKAAGATPHCLLPPNYRLLPPNYGLLGTNYRLLPPNQPLMQAK